MLLCPQPFCHTVICSLLLYRASMPAFFFSRWYARTAKGSSLSCNGIKCKTTGIPGRMPPAPRVSICCTLWYGGCSDVVKLASD
ncbi:hypothetical protein F4819DRAFT_447447 [Hypoxylon fuscum]|nr:hypothetical protein F4819DRAFT_447447 [Hypoxylon fuscum]